MRSIQNVLLIPRVKFGRGLLWAEGESHRRYVAFFGIMSSPDFRISQRKALSPAFSNAAIRRLTSVFYDAAYKVRGLAMCLSRSTLTKLHS